MKDPSGNIRQWLYDILNKTITLNGSYLDCVSFPDDDKTMPYILLAEIGITGEDSPKDRFITECQAVIEVWTSFTGKATYTDVDSVADDILQKVRARTQTLEGSGGSQSQGISGFNMIELTINSCLSQRYSFDNKKVIMKSIIVKLILEET